MVSFLGTPLMVSFADLISRPLLRTSSWLSWKTFLATSLRDFFCDLFWDLLSQHLLKTTLMTSFQDLLRTTRMTSLEDLLSRHLLKASPKVTFLRFATATPSIPVTAVTVFHFWGATRD